MNGMTRIYLQYTLCQTPLRVRLSRIHGSSVVTNGLRLCEHQLPCFATPRCLQAVFQECPRAPDVLKGEALGGNPVSELCTASEPRVVAIESRIGIGGTSGPHAVVSIWTVLRSCGSRLWRFLGESLDQHHGEHMG